MPIKKFKPIPYSRRFRIGNSFKEITCSKPNKKLSKGIKKNSGRNNYGKRTVRHHGGGHKKKYRIIDFKRNKFDIISIVKSIEYDPNRSSFIALINFIDGEKRYIISQNGLKIGDKIISSKKNYIENKIGNSMCLKNIPLGTIVSCVEIKPGLGASIARSAGSFVQVMAKEKNYVIIKLPSGETRRILNNCMATIGSISNNDHKLIKMSKAGQNRWKGIRPRTRGVAMNPVDHPMGGGEGKATGGYPRSRKIIFSKGFKTRKKKNYLINIL